MRVVGTTLPLPLTIAGSARAISIKDLVAGASRLCDVPCGVQTAGPWAEFEGFALHSVLRIEGFY